MVAQDPEVYDCDGCVLRQALEGLDEDNRRAWQLWQRLARRLIVDLHAGSQVLRWALAEDTPEQALVMMDRLSILYETLQPAATRTET